MTDKELLPCPFCGGAPRYLEHKTGFYTERIICDNCHFHLAPDKWQARALAAAPAQAADKDAARYRWLRMHNVIDWDAMPMIEHDGDGFAVLLDKCIDAALAMGTKAPEAAPDDAEKG